MKKLLFIVLISAYGNITSAGFNGLTIHSRANCVNNESISWDATTYRIMATESLHAYNGKPAHWDASGLEKTWRSAAVCWGEAPLNQHNWLVEGRHHMKACWDCAVTELGVTRVTDCSIYNGWWDKSKVNESNSNMKKIVSALLMVPLASWGADLTHQNRIQILPDDIINKDLSDKSRLEQQQERNELQHLGYITTNSENAKRLLAMTNGDMVALQAKGVKDINSPTDTHLKSSLSNLTLAFPPKDFTLSKDAKIIGYAPIGMWSENKGGWTGAVKYFNDRKNGVCRYSQYNIEITNGNVKIPQSKVHYAVNNKPSTSYVIGHPKHGFIYSVEWYTDSYISTLECATKNYDKDHLSRVVTFARQIDSTR